MAEYQCCDFGAPYEPPITESPENDLKCRPSMPSGYIPCNYCQFYASEMCQGCSYFSACVGSITGDSIGGGLTEKEVIAYADSIYDEWERDNYRKDYPRTWRIRLALHRMEMHIIRIKCRFKYRTSISKR